MKQSNFSGLRVVFVNCTLKKSTETSHTAGIWSISKQILDEEKVEHEEIRFADYVVPPGVQPDMTEHGFDRDDWPDLYERIMKSDILIVGSPIWLGERSSVCSRFIERIYSMSAMTNKKGQYAYYGKVGGAIISGNEDGLKHVGQSILYALQHVGYTIPPQADSGWIGEAGPGPSYLDEGSGASKNDFTNRNVTFMTYNMLHLANLYRQSDGIPAYGNVPGEWEDGKRWGFSNPEYR